MAPIERVILWDIEGTLVHTAGVGAADSDAVLALLG
jgi:hypothetical protein